jgi:hypothetical protein
LNYFGDGGFNQMTEACAIAIIEDVVIEAKNTGIVVRYIAGYAVHFIPKAGGFFYIYDGETAVYMNASGMKIATYLFNHQK